MLRFQIWSKNIQTFFEWCKTTRASFQIFFYQICQKFVDLFTKNMKGWSHKKIILYLFCRFDLLRKKVENNFLCEQPFCVQIFPKYFFLKSIIKNICAVYLRVCSTGPLTFSHPSASLLELQLNRAIKNVCLLWMINLDQIYARKWNWPNVVSKYSIWNNSYLPKMGGEVVILANSLISHFQWGLRHSALV